MKARLFRDAKHPGHEGQIQIERNTFEGVTIVGSEKRVAVCSCGWHGPLRAERELAIKDIERHIAVGDAILDTGAEITSLRRMLDNLKQQAEGPAASRVFRDDGPDLETEETIQ